MSTDIGDVMHAAEDPLLAELRKLGLTPAEALSHVKERIAVARAEAEQLEKGKRAIALDGVPK